MEKQYKVNRMISYQDVDFKGHLKLSSLFSILAEQATMHAFLLKVWNKELIEKYGWIVAKMHIEIFEEISCEEEVVFKTWPGKASRVIFPRYYSVENKNGDKLAAISSIWTLLDLEKRRITMPNRVGITFPEDVFLEESTSLPKDIEGTEGCQFVSQRKVTYSDLDTNQHVNNARYIEWVCDILSIEKFEESFISNLTIAFKKEITIGLTVYFYMVETKDSFIVYGANEDNSECYFEVEGLWKKRER